MMRRAAAACAFAAVLATAGAAQAPVDLSVLAKIKAEGLEHSQVAPVFDTLTVDIGPRLTASPAHKRAAMFVRDRLKEYGLDNARLEPWKFGRGWALDKLTVEITEPRYLPLIAYAEAWSPSTPSQIAGAPVYIGGNTPEEVAALGDRLNGAIVLTQPMMTSFVRRDRPQPSEPDYAPGSAAYATTPQRPTAAGPTAAQRIAEILRNAHAAAQLRPSIGEHGTVFVTGRDAGPGAVPSIVVSGEQYNMIVRMLDRHIPVKLRVDVRSTFYDADGGNAFNVVAEIPGTDAALGDEVVMLGGHLDSWHTGVGATDNADGSTTVIEAVRILKAIGVRPRRTIRVALWGGEEQGLLGSKAWVQEHLAGEANRAPRDRFDVYFNIDNGTGPIYGWFLQNDEAVRPVFDAWLAPLKDIGARRNVIEGVGATDHLSFIAAGVPGFNPIQSYVGYDTRTHHTNMDTVDRVNPDEIKQAAIVMAWFVYNAAMSDACVPRSSAPSLGR